MEQSLYDPPARRRQRDISSDLSLLTEYDPCDDDDPALVEGSSSDRMRDTNAGSSPSWRRRNNINLLDPWLNDVCEHGVMKDDRKDITTTSTSSLIPNTQNLLKKSYLKTGTTIVGIAVGQVCILAADTRATAGSLVADRRADKLHRLGRFASAAGAGTSADLEHLTRECYYVKQLQSRLYQRQIGNTFHDDDNDDNTSVLEICHYLQTRLLEQNGACQANLILGGVDPSTGAAHLRALHPHGSVDTLQYAALGSGGLAAMSVLESRYPELHAMIDSSDDNDNDDNDNDDVLVKRAIQLAIDAVRAGIINDLGSGSQVDLVVITPSEGCRYTRSVVAEESLPPHVTRSDASSSSSSSRPGVNGFGNLPYSVRSTRRVRESKEQQEARKLEEWQDILNDEEQQDKS